MSEGEGQRGEDGDRMPERRRQRTEDGGRRTEGRGQREGGRGNAGMPEYWNTGIRDRQKGEGLGDRSSPAIEVPLSRLGGSVRIFGGTGVGRVSKPGLEVAPGFPAVTPGPQTMIARAVEDVLEHTRHRGPVAVEIFVPRGEAIARKTMNARLGINGGISILGTTGVVHPLSHAAYQASILAGIRVAVAAGGETMALTTGRRSERFAQRLRPDLPEEAFLQMGDFFQFAVKTAAEEGLQGIVLAMFWGKAVKMAQGFPHTHAAKSALSLQKLGEWAAALSGDAELVGRIQSANTARHTFQLIQDQLPELIDAVGTRIQKTALCFGGDRLKVRVLILDFEGNPVFQG